MTRDGLQVRAVPKTQRASITFTTRASPGRLEERNVSCPYREWNCDSSVQSRGEECHGRLAE